MRSGIVARAAIVAAMVVAAAALAALWSVKPPQHEAHVVITDAGSFRALMTVSGIVEGEQIFTQLTVLYESPDRMQVTPSGDWIQRQRHAPRRSEVLLGARAWRRLEPPGTWRELAAFEVSAWRRFSLDAFDGLQGFLDQREFIIFFFDSWPLPVTPEGDLASTAGMQVAGEPTISYRRSDPRFLQQVASATDSVPGTPGVTADDATAAAVAEFFGDVVAEYELLVGADTRRVYRFGATLRGRNLDLTYEIKIFDYDRPVTIEPPVP